MNKVSNSKLAILVGCQFRHNLELVNLSLFKSPSLDSKFCRHNQCQDNMEGSFSPDLGSNNSM
jgi:hypothetical protein